MCAKIQKQNSHFSPFYKDNSILVQFILEEYLQFYPSLSHLNTLTQNLLGNKSTFNSISLPLKEFLGNLIGSLPFQERSSHSRWIPSSFTKLRNHCEQFSLNSFHQNQAHIHLHLTVHHAWLLAAHNLELLTSAYSDPSNQSSPSPRFSGALKQGLENLNIRFNQIYRAIPLTVSEYSENENLLLCLVKKNDLLSEMYGKDYLQKRFKIALKLPEIIQLLERKYRSRGFEALLSSILAPQSDQ